MDTLNPPEGRNDFDVKLYFGDYPDYNKGGLVPNWNNDPRNGVSKLAINFFTPFHICYYPLIQTSWYMQGEKAFLPNRIGGWKEAKNQPSYVDSSN